jgi:primosomal protein N'
MNNMDDIIKKVSEMFSNRTILHCDKCHHEADSALGEKCDWCGGNMIKGDKPC